MTQPLDSIGRSLPAPAEPRTTPPYGLLSVLSGQSVQTVRERPEVLESASQQLQYFIETRFGAGASPTHEEVRTRLAGEMGRYLPAMAGTPNLGTMRAALVQRLEVHPEANLLEMLGAAERRWPTRVPHAPPRNLLTPSPGPGLALDPPRPQQLVPPEARVMEQRPDPQQVAAERDARRQRNLADLIDVWRSLPGDKNLYPVQKDEYRAHTLGELERMYGSRAEGLQAVAAIDPALANEMSRWVRPPLR